MESKKLSHEDYKKIRSKIDDMLILLGDEPCGHLFGPSKPKQPHIPVEVVLEAKPEPEAKPEMPAEEPDKRPDDFMQGIGYDMKMSPISALNAFLAAFKKPTEEQVKSIQTLFLRIFGEHRRTLFCYADLLRHLTGESEIIPVHPEITYSSIDTVSGGLKASVSFLLDAAATKEDLAALGKAFKMSGEDYALVLSIDCPGKAAEAAAMLKDIVKTIMAFTMVNAVAFKIASCFDSSVDVIGEKVVWCTKAKPEYRPLGEALWEVLRVMAPLEGDNEVYNLGVEFNTDMEQIATDPKTPLFELLTKMIIKMKADCTYDAHEARMKYLGRVFEVKKVMKMGLMGLLCPTAGKVTIKHDVAYQVKPIIEVASALIKKGNYEAANKAIETVPLIKKAVNFAKTMVDNVELAFHAPKFCFKLDFVARKLGVFLSTMLP